MAQAKQIQRHVRFKGIRQRLLSGMLLLVPFVVTVTVMVWLFAWIRRLLRPALASLFGAIEILPALHRLPTYSVRLIASGMAILRNPLLLQSGGSCPIDLLLFFLKKSTLDLPSGKYDTYLPS